jgi:uncharacterized protein (DUF1800 family)
MTLFWHGHFTSSYLKVGLQSPYMYWQNESWRKSSLGNLSDFLYTVTIDPAMLLYLDLGSSTGLNPNENYARELMELFTMGTGHYTQDDVRAGAKALAGWRTPSTQAMVAADQVDTTLPRAEQAKMASEQESMGFSDFIDFDLGKVGILVDLDVYDAPVTFLGKTAKFTTTMVLDQILSQPAVAPFLVRKLITDFAVPNPTDAFVTRVAHNWVNSKLSIKQLMHDLFTSAEFTAAASYRSLVRSPVEFVVSAIKAVNGAAHIDLAQRSTSMMGQELFNMPDVSGWHNNDAWISSNTMLARVNFVYELLTAIGPNLPPWADARSNYLDGVVGSRTAARLNSAGDPFEQWFVLLTSPEFQLK